MADEFIGKIHSFLTVYDQARKKKASNNLVSDHMFHIYEFLEWGFIFKTCQMVCKMWRETIFRSKYKIYSALCSSIGKSAFVENFTEWRVNRKLIVDPLKKFVPHSKKFINLEHFEIYSNTFGIQVVKLLASCSFENLTSLTFSKIKNFTSKEVRALVNGTLMTKLKTLRFSNYEFDAEFFAALAEAKYLNQLTHLNLEQTRQNSISSFGNGLALFLKDKTNLEYLNLQRFEYRFYSDSLTDGTFKNLTELYITEGQVSSAALVKIIFSPNLPKLHTICDRDSHICNDNISQPLPANITSPLAKLKISESKPNLKRALQEHPN